MRFVIPFLPLLSLSGIGISGAEPVDFTRDIQPILQTHCLRCHGAERPKGGFRVTSRQFILQGGESGPVVESGNSNESRLIAIVEGTDPEMMMPPEGKGDPLSPEQIQLLREWIDLHLPWAESESEPEIRFSVHPMIQSAHVKGNEQKFREHLLMRDGFSGGFQEIFMTQRLSETTDLQVESRLFFGVPEYALRLNLHHRDRGWVEIGYEESQKFYDSHGGFHGPFATPQYKLDEDLQLEYGRFWIEIGLAIPGRPQFVFGYENQFRNGSKSITQWGGVSEGEFRNIYPAYRSLHDRIHRFKLDVQHQWSGFHIENNARLEIASLDTVRTTVSLYNPGIPEPTRFSQVQETHDQYVISDALRLEKEMRDTWFVSAGYHFAHLEADSTFNQETTEAGSPAFGDYWSMREIILNRQSHFMNLNSRWGPYKQVVFSAGIQNEWTRQEGVGEGSLDVGEPGFFFERPMAVDSNLDKMAMEEFLMLRFSGWPKAIFYGETRWRQEEYGQSERQVGGGNDFLRRTDADARLWESGAGMNFTPGKKWNSSVRYHYRIRQGDFDHLRESFFGFPNEGYSAFILQRESQTHKAEARFLWRPVHAFHTRLSLQWQTTGYRNRTEPVQGITPGGELQSGRYEAPGISWNATLLPSPRLRLTAQAGWRKSRTSVERHGSKSVVPFEGSLVDVGGTVLFHASAKSDVQIGYSWSHSDYDQKNEQEGLALGMVYDWHGAHVRWSRQWSQQLTSHLGYSVFDYSEPTFGGRLNYTAHLISAGMGWKLP